MDKDDERAIASVWKLGGLTRRELARRVWTDMYEGDLLTRSAALSYYFLLALFPLLIFLTAMLGHFAEAGTELRVNMLNYLASIAPRSASQLVRATVQEITEGADGGKLSFGLLAALWFASFGMAAVGDTLNSAYGVRETRPFWRVRLISLGLTAALAALIISALALVLYGGEIGEVLAGRYDLGAAFVSTWGVIQWAIVLAFVLFALALIYYYAPDLRDQHWYWITPGSLVGVALWLAVSFGFRLYLDYFDRYSVTYGSLGAVIVLLLWFYLTGAAILVGGKVNAVIEHAAARMGTPEAKLPGEKSPT
ncbi:MAG: YihY/virulence factor BrkB family protein [Acidobacteria bacterium]|nr:YihY/virulence factor BrkB family protein [Acidobacteriota bacterium]MCA1618418.1 YihY/virulence factor BrkB family protein [Acidobacteriota bacterium]